METMLMARSGVTSILCRAHLRFDMFSKKYCGGKRSSTCAFKSRHSMTLIGHSAIPFGLSRAPLKTMSKNGFLMSFLRTKSGRDGQQSKSMNPAQFQRDSHQLPVGLIRARCEFPRLNPRLHRSPQERRW